MVYVSDRAAEKLRQELAQKCLESGLGFRLVVSYDDSGKVTSSMKFDRRHQNDQVIEMDGVTVFSDADSISRIKGFHLDYEGAVYGGFFLKKVARRSQVPA